jgi:hypothetical protein
MALLFKVCCFFSTQISGIRSSHYTDSTTLHGTIIKYVQKLWYIMKRQFLINRQTVSEKKKNSLTYYISSIKKKIYTDRKYLRARHYVKNFFVLVHGTVFPSSEVVHDLWYVRVYTYKYGKIYKYT